MKFLSLLFTSDDNPKAEDILRSYFRKTGDFSAYSFPACIMLSDGIRFDDYIDIGNGSAEITGESFTRNELSLLPVKGINSALGFPFSSRGGKHGIDGITLRIKALAEIERDGSSYRIKRQRALRKDRVI